MQNIQILSVRDNTTKKITKRGTVFGGGWGGGAGFDISPSLVIGHWWAAPTPPGPSLVIGHWSLVVLGYWWPRYWWMMVIGGPVIGRPAGPAGM